MEENAMKLSIWSGYYHDLSPKECVKRFKKHGIFCSELCSEHAQQLLDKDLDHLKTARDFSNFLKEEDFCMSQGHLCLSIRICRDELALPRLFKWIDLYEAIGIKNMVLHCDRLAKTSLTRMEKLDKNVEKLKILAEYIKNKDVTVCLENLRPHTYTDDEVADKNADGLLYVIDRVGSDRLGICLDTGHLNLTGKDQRNFILKAGKHLKALHITDNEGLTDQHLMPFSRGNIDFSEVVRALREVGYSGLFNLEIPGETDIPLELRDAKIAYIKSAYDYLMRS